MTQPTTIGDYGIDAPPVIRNLIIVGVAIILAAVVLNLILVSVQYLIGAIVLIWGLLAGVSMLVAAALMVWSSKVGKLRMRERLIDSLGLAGSETVLDIGCGRGLLLNAAARHLTNGKAIGVDLWQDADQSGNRPENALANAQIEGVADRVEVKTADMRDLPFDDKTIDVVVSSMAIHNVPDKEGRAKAVREIERVLKPYGKLILLDFQRTEEYVQTLRNLGWLDVEVSGLLFAMFPPVRTVTGKKPA